jgi:hypothetical protein
MILQHVPRAMGGKPTPSQIFEGDHEELEVRKFGNIDFPKPFVSFVRSFENLAREVGGYAASSIGNNSTFCPRSLSLFTW